jgi:hypothetical protein
MQKFDKSLFQIDMFPELDLTGIIRDFGNMVGALNTSLVHLQNYEPNVCRIPRHWHQSSLTEWSRFRRSAADQLETPLLLATTSELRQSHLDQKSSTPSPFSVDEPSSSDEEDADLNRSELLVDKLVTQLLRILKTELRKAANNQIVNRQRFVTTRNFLVCFKRRL